jgi:hypothetical protein
VDAVVAWRMLTVLCVGCVYVEEGLSVLFGRSETNKQLGFNPSVAKPANEGEDS